MNEPSEQTEQLPVEQTVENSMPALIQAAVTNPDITPEKLDKLLDINIKFMDMQAEQDFNAAMARLQPKLPEVKKKTEAHNSKYAKYEHIERIIRPLYTAEGFSMSFTSKLEGTVETYYGTLSHSGGHSITGQMALPPDTSGSKNDIQAKGSTISYARRYILSMLLNIITVDEDDDGDGACPISEEQFQYLQNMLDDMDMDAQQFCEWAKVDALANVQSKDYNRLKQALIARKSKQ